MVERSLHFGVDGRQLGHGGHQVVDDVAFDAERSTAVDQLLRDALRLRVDAQLLDL